MWRAKVVRIAPFLVDLAMAGITQTAAMAEDVERAGIAGLARPRRGVVGLGIVEEDTPFVGRLAVEDAVDLQIGLCKPVLRRGEEIPQGWIVDSEGRHTTDPGQYRKGGALLPLGGSEGYKGSGLAAMVEVLCGLLTGLGFGVEPTGRHNDGCFMAVFNVAAFRPLKDFKAEVAEFARYLKSTPPSEGSSGVFYPGEVEYLREQKRKVEGIEVEDATWDKLKQLARDCRLAAELGLA